MDRPYNERGRADERGYGGESGGKEARVENLAIRDLLYGRTQKKKKASPY